ncbi:MAG: 3-isopropylmalate dehydratase small subunit [bacterium]
MIYKGKVFKFGDDINTDEIIPAKFLNMSRPEELAGFCMAGIDEGFVKKIKPGDIMVGGKNFGCGSSREHAPICIKAAGISCVIAKTFARIFYRNAINIGLPIIECPPASEALAEGDSISVDAGSGVITNLSGNQTYQAQAFPPFMQELIEAGGLMNYTKRHFPAA